MSQATAVPVSDVVEEIKREGAVAEPLSEDYLGLRFAYEYHAKLRYTAESGRWNEYQNGVWNPDRTLHAFDLARSLCRSIASEVNDEKLAGLRRQLTSASTVAAVVKFAQAYHRLAMTADQWDASPYLLNTPGGTIDLKTGEMKPHDPNDYCSKATAATPTPKGTEIPPLWRKFLRDITCEDQELESFLRRAYGYSLSASVNEQALVFTYGGGFNGKTTFLNTITGAMGSYHKTAATETFMSHQHAQHPCDIADLAGSRLVTAVETSSESYFNEPRIKMLTGRDRQKGRFMRCNPTEYTPTQKFWIAGNHRPRLRIIDKGIAGRLLIVPFMAYFPPESPGRVKDIEEQLKSCWPNVLQWGIEGFTEYDQRGLDPPACVRDATTEYFESQDALGRWREEHTELKPAFTSSEELHKSFHAWAERTGEIDAATWSLRKLSDELVKDERLKRDKKWDGLKQVRGFVGIALLGRKGDDL